MAIRENIRVIIGLLSTVRIGGLVPPGPTEGTYKVTYIINAQAVSTTFDVPECSQQ
jgi:hypothetical protein